MILMLLDFQYMHACIFMFYQKYISKMEVEFNQSVSILKITYFVYVPLLFMTWNSYLLQHIN